MIADRSRRKPNPIPRDAMTPARTAYHNRRKQAAIPRWMAIAAMRKEGMLYKTIAKALGISITCVQTMETKWHDYRIANRL